MSLFGAAALIFGFLSTGFSIYRYFSDKEDAQKSEAKQLDLAQSNLDLNKEVSNQNFELSKEQFEYQKQLNDTLMQREDTAFQRQVADLKAAGLSPLMATGGASASPLTSANAPQRDVSGINTALGNLIGAYNDIYNRRLNRQQFAMQNSLNRAQFAVSMLDTANNMKKSLIEQQILKTDLKYFKDHPERNLGLSNVLINLASSWLSKNGSALNTTLPTVTLPKLSQGSGNPSADKLFDLLSPGNQEAAKDSLKDTIRSILPVSKTKEVTQEDIDKDLNNLNKSQKKRVDIAIASLGLQKDFEKNIKTVWDYTNAKVYYKDFDEFKAVLLSKKPAQRAKYLNSMNIRYIERKAPSFGK